MADIKDFSPTVQYSVINSLRTGNVVIDTILGLMIPTILGCVYAWFGKVKTEIQSYFESKKTVPVMRTFQRTITYDPWDVKVGDATLNHMLQRAVKMYMSDKLGLETAPNGNIFIKSLNDIHSPQSSKELNDLKVYTTPSNNDTIVLDNGISVQITTTLKENARTGYLVQAAIHIILKCPSRDGGSQTITQFVNDAMQWYQKQMESREDNSRFMYNPMMFDSTMSGERSRMQYRRYKLYDGKTFASLFFEHKDSLMQLMTHFQNKTGRYAIPGSPYKLGLLLHGQPGTGKTSFIKALAHATQRNIVNIKLSQIETNQDLMDIVFDRQFSMQNGTTTQLPFGNIIFVMEDIDAASNIVQCRTVETTAPTIINEPDNLESPQGVRAFWQQSQKDKLNLAGILNVLDGCVETPGRIVIMTTNHPEKLDPALIRPGRIDRQVYFGHMSADDAQKLVEHYFDCKLNKKQSARLASAFYAETPLPRQLAKGVVIVDHGGKHTPAELESICLSHDSVDECIEAVVSRRHTRHG